MAQATVPRPERADAARNRAAILRAAEDLLREHGPERVSLDLVAATAGVGKGTVFRRFGSRTGLFQALLAERAALLAEAITDGPPPLGPGAPAAERLLAFLDALGEIAHQNLALISAHERACADGKYEDPTYRRWHAHVTALVGEARPAADASFVAHALLGCFDGDLVRLMEREGPGRFRESVRTLARDLTEG